MEIDRGGPNSIRVARKFARTSALEARSSTEIGATHARNWPKSRAHGTSVCPKPSLGRRCLSEFTDDLLPEFKPRIGDPPSFSGGRLKELTLNLLPSRIWQIWGAAVIPLAAEAPCPAAFPCVSAIAAVQWGPVAFPEGSHKRRLEEMWIGRVVARLGTKRPPFSTHAVRR